MFRRYDNKVPGLNTASLPDLIFTVLFFFMIVTHMRDVQLKVKYQVPQGTELDKLTKKSTITYIYIGTPLQSSSLSNKTSSSDKQESTRIQINDKFVEVSEIGDYIRTERSRMSPEDLKKMKVSIKADKQTTMGIITDVKQALREANALNINYSATSVKRK